MLKQRIITALILAPLASFAILYLPLFSFQIMIALVVGLGAWEWSSMSGMTRIYTKGAYASLMVFICLGFCALLPTELIWYEGQLNSLYAYILSLSVIWWIVSFAMILAYPGYSSIWYTSKILRGIFGVLTLIPTWVAIVSLRAHEYGELSFYGASLIFDVLGIVWAADIGAFFVGVKFGKHKLRPRVSPGKTYEGLMGGIFASSLIIAFAATHYEFESSKIWIHIVVGALTVGVSALGDLNESMFKRCAGIKDSGTLLPGHGGIMDRIDSLTAAFPVFAFCYVMWMA
jgi:phosphatidate cytidylyltransferase